jgi:mannose-6-phosphate isomerase
MSLFTQPWKLVPNKVRGEGGREIDRFRGVTPPMDDAKGSEAWVGSVTRAFNAPKDNPDMGLSEVLLPDGRCLKLDAAIALDPEAVLGTQHLARHGSGLGMLIKLLDSKRQYTLQAHPTRPTALKLWNSPVGKEESWYVIGTRDDVAEPPYILLGFKESISRELFEKLYRENDLKTLQTHCHKIAVKEGDVFFVGGGLPHALGPGCLVVEVQEPSELTVVPLQQMTLMMRMCGGNEEEARSRLVEEAVYEKRMLNAFIYEGRSEEENLRRWRIAPKSLREGAWGREQVLIGQDQTAYFSFTRTDLKGRVPLRQTGFPQVGIVMEGEGVIRYAGGELSLRKGEELFLPHSIPEAELEGTLSLVLCHPEGVRHFA